MMRTTIKLVLAVLLLVALIIINFQIFKNPLVVKSSHWRNKSDAPFVETTSFYSGKLVSKSNTIYRMRNEVKILKHEFTKERSIGKSQSSMILAVVCCGDRVNETKVLIKSAIALSSHRLIIKLFADDDSFPTFKDMISEWPLSVLNRVQLDVLPVEYPSNTKIWKQLFKPCASLRLFIPSILHSIDSLVYVDTDTVFVSPLEKLWQHFSRMNGTHMAAMASEHEDLATGWYNRFAKHPFYGRLGVNSGVMLMNLTRLRKFSWEEYLLPIYEEFKSKLTWGDQDIINIIFHYHPDKMYLLSCEYNFRPDHCMYMSVCRSIDANGGVFVMHGSRKVFHNQKQPAFKAVYNAWQRYTLGSDLRQDLYYPMQRYLLQAKESNCGKLYKEILHQISLMIPL